MNILEFISKYISAAVLPPVLIFSGIFFIIYLRGFYILHPVKTLRLMLKKEGGKTKTSPFRVLTVSLAGTLGVGNIVGVAVAIILGGAGAVFWMWVSAIASMILKYCEIVLAVRYRVRGEKGEKLGGPMYYMRDGVGNAVGKIMALAFSALGLVSSLALGNFVQINAASDAVHDVFGMPKIVVGIALCAICGLVVIGGFKGISDFTVAMIPIMSILYIGLSLRAILSDAQLIMPVFREIFSSAFSAGSAAGGLFGFLISGAVRHGMAKGTYSHEGGSGTAPMSHAKSDTEIPAKQGIYGIIEVFFDTVIVCTITALVILISQSRYGFSSSGSGMQLVISSFAGYYGKYSGYIVSIAVLFFAFSTVVCWSYYGRCCLQYLTKSKKAEKFFMIIYCLSIIVGSVTTQRLAWELADIGVVVMTVVNLSAVIWLRKEVRKETEPHFLK